MGGWLALALLVALVLASNLHFYCARPAPVEIKPAVPTTTSNRIEDRANSSFASVTCRIGPLTSPRAELVRLPAPRAELVRLRPSRLENWHGQTTGIFRSLSYAANPR
jgi:hypothetical protein